MVSAGAGVSKEAGGAAISQRLSWCVGELEVGLSEAPVGGFEPPPWEASMSTVLLFIDPLGRMRGAVWGASVFGENCPWLPNRLEPHLWPLTSDLSLTAFLLSPLFFASLGI